MQRMIGTTKCVDKQLSDTDISRAPPHKFRKKADRGVKMNNVLHRKNLTTREKIPFLSVQINFFKGTKFAAYNIKKAQGKERPKEY